MNNVSQELGEYIGALHIIWSDGKENRIGDHGDLKRGVSVTLEEGEHIVKTFQLFWGPRHVFVPLEIVDFIFFTNRGRKFGPFTKQVWKSCEEGDLPRRPDSWAQVSHKLNCRKISRRVDSPLVPMCRPASLHQMSTTSTERLEEDTNWASWLDGFLCVTKRGKVTRITLKFAVYLDCFYLERKPAVSQPPVLYSYTLKDLKNNLTDRPIKIHDQDYLWDNLVTPYQSSAEDDKTRIKKRNVWNNPYLMGFDSTLELPGGGGILEPLPLPNPEMMGPVLLQPVPLQDAGDNEPPPMAPEGANGGNQEEENQNNNSSPPSEAGAEEGENNEADEADEPNIHDHVWDALINDDLRQIGDLYERRNINVENYLE